MVYVRHVACSLRPCLCTTCSWLKFLPQHGLSLNLLLLQVEQMLKEFDGIRVLMPEAAALRDKLMAARAWAQRAQHLLAAPPQQALPEQELSTLLRQACTSCSVTPSLSCPP